MQQKRGKQESEVARGFQNMMQRTLRVMESLSQCTEHLSQPTSVVQQTDPASSESSPIPVNAAPEEQLINRKAQNRCPSQQEVLQ